MSKVFISRPDGNVAWGFRLQGGFEYNEPLTLTNIQPSSPADGKIDPGDILIEIAGNNVTHMTHRDALELIQRCGNALFLTVHKVGHAYPSGPTQIRRSFDRKLSYDYGQSSSPSFPVANIPRAPIFDADLITKTAASLNNRQPITESHTSYEQTTDFSNMPAVIAKSLGRPGGPKPFTYTPGGLDLSKLLDSARARRLRFNRSSSEDIQGTDRIMNRRMIVPPEQMNQHHYAGVNPIQPFSYARQQPTPPKKHIQHDTDVITQSRSFQMLEGWIEDSEKTIPALTSPPPPSPSSSAVARAVHDEQHNTGRRVSSGGASTLPSRSFRYLQEQYSIDNSPPVPTTPTATIEEPTTPGYNSGLRRGSDAQTPSRSFKFLQDQYPISPQTPTNRSQGINNRDDLIEIYNKPPPSFREREPEALRYTGSTVPSRSFRFLQMMTQDDDPTPVAGYTKPQQLLINKYDEQILSTNTNRINEHPSRSFKYLQEMTGEQKSTINQTGRRTTNEINSTDNNGTSDF